MIVALPPAGELSGPTPTALQPGLGTVSFVPVVPIVPILPPWGAPISAVLLVPFGAVAIVAVRSVRGERETRG